MLGSPHGASWQGRRTTDTLALALAVSFETAAHFTELNDIPCWATLGAARLDRVHIPPSVRFLIFAEDNDAEGRRRLARRGPRIALAILNCGACRHQFSCRLGRLGSIIEERKNGR